MLPLALKEWSSLCALLATGKIIGILRKGGLLDAPGELDTPRGGFWLHPTQFHENQTPLRPGWTVPNLDWMEAWRQRPGFVPLPAWCQVTGSYQIQDWDTALAWASLSPYTDEVVRTRFHYRAPGVRLYTLRVYPATPVHWVIERPEWAGCKSFHELDRPLPEIPVQPILDDEAYRREVLRIEEVLRPVGFA